MRKSGFISWITQLYGKNSHENEEFLYPAWKEFYINFISLCLPRRENHEIYFTHEIKDSIVYLISLVVLGMLFNIHFIWL